MDRPEHHPGLAPTPGYLYAQQVADQLFVAGQVPLAEDGTLVGKDDAQAQAHQCLHNLFSLIEQHGFAATDIRQLTIYVVGDGVRLVAAWEAVRGWFDAAVPPATLLGVATLGYEGQLVEVGAVVLRG